MGGGDGDGVTYKGMTLHHPKRWHTVTGRGWFWVLYRAKQDGPVVLVSERFQTPYVQTKAQAHQTRTSDNLLNTHLHQLAAEHFSRWNSSSTQ